MDKNAYELLMDILGKRSDRYKDTDPDMSWVYGNVREMVRLAQLGYTEELRQYDN